MAHKKRRKTPGAAAGPAAGAGKATDPAAEALVEGLLDRHDVAGLQALAANPDRGRRDLARRALHRLRERGVDVPDAGPSATALRLRAAAGAEDGVPASRATGVDGTGAQIIWLVLPGGRAGGLRVAQVVTTEREGIEEIRLDRLGRSEWRRLWSALSARETLDGAILTAVPTTEAAGWLREAALRDPLAREARAQVGELRQWLAEVPAAAEGPVTIYAALGEDPVDGPADAGADVLERRAFRGWGIEGEALEAIDAALKGAEGAGIELTAAQKAERRDAILDERLDAWFDEGQRARLRARVERAAHVVLHAEGPEAARRMVAAARSLADGRPASGLPWVRQMFARWFDPAAGEDPGPGASLDPPGGDG